MALVETSCPVIVPPARGSLVPSATVMSALPSNATLLMLLAVCNLVAVDALRLSAPVKVDAVRLPVPVSVATAVAPAYHLKLKAPVFSGRLFHSTPLSIPNA